MKNIKELEAVIEQTKQEYIQRLECDNPHLKGMKHTFFVLTYKDGKAISKFTRIASTPHELTDQEIEQVAKTEAIENPPQVAHGKLVSIERGSNFENILRHQYNKQN